MRAIAAFVALFAAVMVGLMGVPNVAPHIKHQLASIPWEGQARINHGPGPSLLTRFAGNEAQAATYNRQPISPDTHMTVRPATPKIPGLGSPTKVPNVPKPVIPVRAKTFMPPSRGATDPQLYEQVPYPVTYESVKWETSYTGSAVPTGPGNCGGQFFNVAGTNNYPYPNFIDDALVQPMTFYAGDGTGVNTIGIIGTPGTVPNSGQYYVNALQGGSTVGVSLAPRAVDPNGTSGGLTNLVVLNDYLPCSPYPTPWTSGTTIQYSIDMVIPFVYSSEGSGGLVENNGMSFVYFVLELRNINDGSSIVIAPRIMQSQNLVGSDVTGPNAPVFAFAQSSEANTVTLTPDYALIYPPIGSSSIVSSCGSPMSIGPAMGPSGTPLTFCFQMNGAGLTQAISDLNSGLGKSYDTTPANWEVVAINLDMEAWAWSYPIDARLGLSYSNFVVQAF